MGEGGVKGLRIIQRNSYVISRARPVAVPIPLRICKELEQIYIL